jgi:hypothetical protein
VFGTVFVVMEESQKVPPKGIATNAKGATQKEALVLGCWLNLNL